MRLQYSIEVSLMEIPTAALVTGRPTAEQSKSCSETTFLGKEDIDVIPGAWTKVVVSLYIRRRSEPSHRRIIPH